MAGTRGEMGEMGVFEEERDKDRQRRKGEEKRNS